MAGGPFKFLRYIETVMPALSHALLMVRAKRQARRASARASDRRFPPDGYRRVSPPIPAPTPTPNATVRRPRIYSEPLGGLDVARMAEDAAVARAHAGYTSIVSAPGTGSAHLHLTNTIYSALRATGNWPTGAGGVSLMTGIYDVPTRVRLMRIARCTGATLVTLDLDPDVLGVVIRPTRTLVINRALLPPTSPPAPARRGARTVSDTLPEFAARPVRPDSLLFDELPTDSTAEIVASALIAAYILAASPQSVAFAGLSPVLVLPTNWREARTSVDARGSRMLWRACWYGAMELLVPSPMLGFLAPPVYHLELPPRDATLSAWDEVVEVWPRIPPSLLAAKHAALRMVWHHLWHARGVPLMTVDDWLRATLMPEAFAVWQERGGALAFPEADMERPIHDLLSPWIAHTRGAHLRHLVETDTTYTPAIFIDPSQLGQQYHREPPSPPDTPPDTPPTTPDERRSSWDSPPAQSFP